MPVVQGPEGPVPFPDDMSDAEIERAMRENYPPISENMDMLKGAGQGLRDVGEHILSAPGDMDHVEQVVLNWLKTQAGDAPILQSMGLQDVPKRFANNWEAVSKKLFPDVPMPTHDDVQWTEKQLGLPDQYQPQTTAGNIARYGTAGLAGAAIGGPPAVGMAGRALANPYVQQFGMGALKGAGLTGGGLGMYKLYQNMKP